MPYTLPASECCDGPSPLTTDATHLGPEARKMGQNPGFEVGIESE